MLRSLESGNRLPEGVQKRAVGKAAEQEAGGSSENHGAAGISKILVAVFAQAAVVTQLGEGTLDNPAVGVRRPQSPAPARSRCGLKKDARLSTGLIAFE